MDKTLAKITPKDLVILKQDCPNLNEGIRHEIESNMFCGTPLETCPGWNSSSSFGGLWHLEDQTRMDDRRQNFYYPVEGVATMSRRKLRSILSGRRCHVF